MIATRKHLARRTFLRGVGASIALPLLDGMVPALSAVSKSAAKPIPRFGAIYVPNGVIMRDWTPAAEGAAFELTPILEPLAPFRERLLVLTGLNNQVADSIADGGGAHTRSSAAFLTGVCAKRTEGADLQLGISMDQIVANELGEDNLIPSLQLSLENNNSLGTCEVGFSCAYRNFSWSGPTTPLPMEANPRIVFERLFGDSGSTDPKVRSADAREKRSILDSVTQEVARLRTALGPRDRNKLTEYLEAVRDTERRIQISERETGQLPTMTQPQGIPSHYGEHAKLMFDLVWLALRSDRTRVFTMMLGTESSDRPYPECGVPDPYHPLTHHGGNQEKMAGCARINRYHVEMTSYLLERLQSTADGDGCLLDHTTLIHGSGMSDGSRHNHNNVPIVVVGGQSNQIKGGRHLQFPPETPLANLHVTVLNKLGIPTERLGDSTGELSGV